MTQAEGEIQFENLIDDAKLGPIHIWVVSLCFCVAMLDGFDTLSIGFVAPLIAETLQLSKQEMSFIFSSALAGIFIGSLTFSLVGDRIGRRAVIIGACIVIGVFSLLTATASNFAEFALFRFITGIGLGASLPNLYALVSDYSPARRKAIMVTAMFVGFSVGATAGAAISNFLSQRYGWQMVFMIGGIAPVVFSLVLAVLLPESIRLLARQDPKSMRAKRLLSRIDPTYEPLADDHLIRQSAQYRPASPIELFKNKRANATLLFWSIYFTNLMTGYSLASWMPTILSESGVPLDQAVWAASLTEMGGVIGGLALASLIDRVGPTYILSGVFAFGVLAFLAMGLAGALFALLLLVGFAMGVCVTGGQHTLNALSSTYYPASVRSTGVGYCLASGRIGAIVGPILIGQVLANGLGRFAAFSVMAAMIFVSVLLSLVLIRELRQQRMLAN